MNPDLELYHQLMVLCGEPDSPFFYKDFLYEGVSYRIFNYRLASYSDFCKPGALWARGIMYELPDPSDSPGALPELACRPMPKFFNWGENPFTMNIDPAEVHQFMDKRDGSLISTFAHYHPAEDYPRLRVKSKGSLTSDQAQMALDFLRRPENEDLTEALYYTTMDGYTVNMELTSPCNRIVLPYKETELRILNVVNNYTGKVSYRYGQDCLDAMTDIGDRRLARYWVDYMDIMADSKRRFLESIDDMTDIEGYVILLRGDTPGRQLVKKKTKWYLNLHANKESITIPRRLFNCIITETVDDLRSLFSDDEAALKIISDMEAMVLPKFNHICATVDSFYEANKSLSRKDFAIKGLAEMGDLFHLAMNKYLVGLGKNKPVDMKEWAMKNYEMFGIKQTEAGESEE